MALFARVIGTVFRKEHRSGIARESQQPYEMDVVHVLVPNAGVSEVTLPRPDQLATITGGVIPEVGQSVDWLVEVAQGARGQRVSILRDENYEALKAQMGAAAWSSPEPSYSAAAED